MTGRGGRDAIYLFFAINYFAQGMSGIVYEPISYLLKDGLGLSAGQSAVFVSLMTLPFLLKPLFALGTDFVAVGGWRRRPHIRLVSALAAASWLALAAKKSYSYGALLSLLLLVNVGVVGSDVVCDAVMVEQGKASRRTGVYQAVQIGTLYATLVFTGLGGGWLAARLPVRRVFALSSVFPLMILLSAGLARETPVAEAPRQALAGLRALLRDRRAWALSLFIFLWSFYPFLGTAQFYYQSAALGFGPVYIGTLATIGGLAGAAGAAFYGRAVDRAWSTRSLVRGAVLLYGPLSLLYVLYLGPASAAVLTALFGFTGVVFRLALMDLAAQSCPAYAEATAFAAYMAVFNLAASASNAAGGRLYDLLTGAFAGTAHPAQRAVAVLALIGSACTMACWWLLPAVEAPAAA